MLFPFFSRYSTKESLVQYLRDNNMLECQDGDDDEEAWDMSSSISSSDSEFHHCRYFPSLLPMLLFHVWYIDTDDCYQCFCSIYDIYLWYLLLILKYSKIFFFRWLIGGGGGRCCQTNVSNVSKQQIRWPQCVQKKENDRSRNDGPCSNKRASVARSEWCLSGWIIQVRSSSMFVECSKKLMHIWTLFPDHFFHFFNFLIFSAKYNCSTHHVWKKCPMMLWWN